MDSREGILTSIADSECKRIARKVIRRLQMMKDSLQSGDDSPLKSTWDEVCVQVQGQESGTWDVYLDTIDAIILGFVEQLDKETKQAIWLQTSEAEEWEDEGDHDDIPWSEEEIAQHILHRYVLSAAADWTNVRIEKFKEQ
jgi:hypothetical protein